MYFALKLACCFQFFKGKLSDVIGQHCFAECDSLKYKSLFGIIKLVLIQSAIKIRKELIIRCLKYL